MRKKGEERRYGSDAHRPSVTFTSFCICIRIYFIDSVVPLRLRRLVGGFSESVSKCQKYTKSEMIPEFFPPTFLPLNFELVFGKMNMLLKRDGEMVGDVGGVVRGAVASACLCHHGRHTQSKKRERTRERQNRKKMGKRKLRDCLPIMASHMI